MNASRSDAAGARFNTKPPFEPTGTITVFFTICALTRPEHLGAEVLRPVGPAQAAARDLAAAQMHALEARRVDEDLEHRLRLGQPGHLGRIELERQEACAAGPRHRGARNSCAFVASISARYCRSTRSSDRLSDVLEHRLDRALLFRRARTRARALRRDRSAS